MCPSRSSDTSYQPHSDDDDHSAEEDEGASDLKKIEKISKGSIKVDASLSKRAGSKTTAGLGGPVDTPTAAKTAQTLLDDQSTPKRASS